MVSEEKYERLIDKCVQKDTFIRNLGHVLRGCRCGIVTRNLLEELCLVESQLETTDSFIVINGDTHIRLQDASSTRSVKSSLSSTPTWPHSGLEPLPLPLPHPLPHQPPDKPEDRVHRHPGEIYPQVADPHDRQFVESRYPNPQSAVSRQFLNADSNHDNNSYTPDSSPASSQYVTQVVNIGLSESDNFGSRVNVSGVGDAYSVSGTMGRDSQQGKGDGKQHVYLQHDVDGQFTPASPRVEVVNAETVDLYATGGSHHGHFPHGSEHVERFLQHDGPPIEIILNDNEQNGRCIHQQGTETQQILLNANGESDQFIEHETSASPNQAVEVHHNEANDEQGSMLNNLTDFAYPNFVQFPTVSQSDASTDILNLQAQVVSMQMTDSQVQHVTVYKPYETSPCPEETSKSPVSRPDANKCRKPSSRGSIGVFQAPKHRCDVCGKGFAKLSKLNEHVRVHTGEKPYKCPTCQKCFAQSGTLKYHMRIHSGERPFTCSDCGKTFTQPGQLSSHELIHREKSFKCHLCKKSFPEESQLERHLMIHKKERPHRCEKCGKSFLHEGNLEIHKQKCLVTDNDDDDLKCKDCGETLPSYDELKEHDRSHSKDKPHQCEICSKRFKAQVRLAKHLHLHAVVKNERSHMCDACGQCFCKPSLLKVHMRVHSGEKPFMCDFCGKFLGSANNLRRHVQSHSGERNFKCNECGKGFATSHNLEYHSRIHSGLKPFKCDLCGKAFPFSFSLDRHMRTHTKGCRT